MGFPRAETEVDFPRPQNPCLGQPSFKREGHGAGMRTHTSQEKEYGAQCSRLCAQDLVSTTLQLGKLRPGKMQWHGQGHPAHSGQGAGI